MCVWKRLHLLETTLTMLSEQTDLGFDVYLWNNNIDIASDVDEIIAKPYKYNVQARHYETNIGGAGRFYMANQLANQYDYVVFIDDDQHFNKELISTFKSEADPATISGWWAWKLKTAYDDRIALQIGQEGNYIGTGGMICPCHIFTEESLFHDLPQEYLFVEDLWLSQWALHIKNFQLKKSKVIMGFIPNEGVRDQCISMPGLKVKFYKYLQQKFTTNTK